MLQWIADGEWKERRLDCQCSKSLLERQGQPRSHPSQDSCGCYFADSLFLPLYLTLKMKVSAAHLLREIVFSIARPPMSRHYQTQIRTRWHSHLLSRVSTCSAFHYFDSVGCPKYCLSPFDHSSRWGAVSLENQSHLLHPRAR